MTTTTTLTDDQARELAYQWHGGMSSPLYAFASSGLVKCTSALAREIRACQHDASKERYDELQALCDYIGENVWATRPGAAWPHHAAPWARKEMV